VRVGVWDLEGHWSTDHAHALDAAGCDIWLLTDVRPRVVLEGYHQHLTAGTFGEGRHWAGVLARGVIDPLPDPHPASAAAWIDGLLVCSSVLPWPFAEEDTPWADEPSHAGAMTATLADVETALKGNPALWGGTWSQPLEGNIVGFSPSAQEAILATVGMLGLQVPTATQRNRHGRGQYTVDQLAVPTGWEVVELGSFAIDESSEHDAYWVEVEPA
jgi:hypothetical protein